MLLCGSHHQFSANVDVGDLVCIMRLSPLVDFDEYNAFYECIKELETIYPNLISPSIRY